MSPGNNLLRFFAVEEESRTEGDCDFSPFRPARTARQNLIQAVDPDRHDR